MSVAIAVAHPNIALSKYWGKRAGGGNFPAVPSLSVTLEGLSTRSLVRFDGSLDEDRVVLNDQPADESTRQRVVTLLDRVRAETRDPRRAEVTSRNDFPTASGLASSASGFAALALASVRAAGLDWDSSRVSDLARRSSGSAARSVFGGFVELDAGPVAPREGDCLAARPLTLERPFPLVVLVAVVSESAKAVGSTAGMDETLSRSPFAAAWLEEAPKIHARLRVALLTGDFWRVGEIAEASALAMHASAIAAGVVYWTGATLGVLQAVRALRSSGVAAYATIDAGPHVKVLVRPDEAPRALETLRTTPGVRRVIEARPGKGAYLVSGPLRGSGASSDGPTLP